MAHLNGDQIGRLQRAMLDGFSRDELEQLALVHLDRDFAHVAPNATLDVAVLHFIQQAEREGWTVDLLRAVAAGRPLRQDLQVLVADFLRALETTRAPDASDAGAPVAQTGAARETEEEGSVRQNVSVSGHAETGNIIQIGKVSGKVDLD